MTRKAMRRRKIRDHVIGPAGSVALHILLIYLAVHFIVFEAREEEPEFLVSVVEPETPPLIDELWVIEPPDVERTEFHDEPMDISLPDEQVEPVTEVPDFAQTENQWNLSEILPVESPLRLDSLFRGRDAGEREILLAEYGGKWGELTEDSVRRALEWLRINQHEDGSWDHGSRAPAAMTGLGLLTFLAHGETVQSAQYGHAVRRAIRWLTEDIGEDGHFQGAGSGNAMVYGQAIAAYAIAEAYAMTRIPSLRDVMDKSIQVIIDGQQPRGGWDYHYAQGARRDTSISGFNIQGMKAAQLAGTTVRGVQQAMDMALEDLLAVYNPRTHHFGYSSMQARNESMTALSCLLFQLAGNPRAPQVRHGVQAMRDMRVNWNDAPPGAMYTWYYVTQAMFQSGGRYWETWNDSFAPAFVHNQNRDGSWTSPSGRLPAGTAHREVNYGPVYSTTLAALSLQVYYRILPTFAVVEEPEEEKEDDDVVIQII